METKIRAAIELLNSILSEHQITQEEYAEFGRTVVKVIPKRYDILSICVEDTCNPNWPPFVVEMWKAAKKVQLHK